MNPFITSGYVSPEYFCDREKEAKRLKSALENNTNVTLLSIRRMGKTGLIKHVYHNLQRRHLNLVYLDIVQTNSLSDFINAFTNAILKKFRSKPAAFLQEMGELIRNVRPVINFDKSSGEPQASITFASPQDSQDSIDNIFEYLKSKSLKKSVYIAIDEFQQITKYPENNVEAILRSHIQDIPAVPFIFSGSKNSIMQSMFYDARRPFYQSTEFMELRRIEDEHYLRFINENFKKGGFTIDEKTILSILKWTRTHTFYVQYFCYKLFTTSEKNITVNTVRGLCDNILEENESIYAGYENLLTSSEWRLLRAIAKEESVAKPTSIDFIKKYELGGASSVSYSLKRLIATDMIYNHKGSYYVYDVFFSRWLERA